MILMEIGIQILIGQSEKMLHREQVILMVEVMKARIDVKVLASGSKGNCYHVGDGETALLIECGIPFKKIQEKINFRLFEIEGILVSHEHKDHTRAIEKMLSLGIQIYTSAGTAKALNIAENCFVTTVRSDETFNIGTFLIKGFNVNHDAAEPIGYLIRSTVTNETLLFFTDTYYLDYTFNCCDYMIVECNFSESILYRNLMSGVIDEALYKRVYKSHMSIEKLKDFLMACDLSHLKRIWLAHISDGNSDQALFKREIQRLTGAEVIVT